MRKIFSIFLLFSVLVSSTGFTLTKHFCGEVLEHVTVHDQVKTCCGDEEENMPDDCCHDELEQVLLDDFQLDHQSLQLQPLAFFAVSALVHYFTVYTDTPSISPLWAAFHSPPLPDVDVYLRVQSFLI